MPEHIVNGLESASRLKPNGKKPRGGQKVLSIRGGISLTASTSIFATVTAISPARTPPSMMTIALPLLWGTMRRGRVHMESMTWQGKSGGGERGSEKGRGGEEGGSRG